MWAVGQGKEKIVELLLKYGADVHIKIVTDVQLKIA